MALGLVRTAVDFCEEYGLDADDPHDEWYMKYGMLDDSVWGLHDDPIWDECDDAPPIRWSMGQISYLSDSMRDPFAVLSPGLESLAKLGTGPGLY